MGFPFDEDLDRCPHAVIAEGEIDPWPLIEAWSDWHLLGVLPYGETMGEQPAWYAQALSIIESAYRRRKAATAPVANGEGDSDGS